MTYLSPSPTPPRLWEVWDALKARLSTTRMAELLGGAGRVYTAVEEYPDRESPRAPWGRVVIVPVTRPGGQELGGRERLPEFLVRAEVASPGGGYNPARMLEAVHDEAFGRLEGWRPEGLTLASVQFPVYRHRAPQAMPLWDEDRGLWILSAAYRFVAGPIS